MICEKNACSEQFCEKVAQFTLYSWDIVKNLHGCAILLLSAMRHKQVLAANRL